MEHTVKLANWEVTWGLLASETLEDSLLLTAAEGTDSKEYERWAMIVVREMKGGWVQRLYTSPSVWGG